jgi:D-alanyl-D-alanine carboxypeptidase
MKNIDCSYPDKFSSRIIVALLLMVFTVGVYAQTETKTGDLDKYLGVYSTVSVPLKFTISKNGNTLFARGTGQAPLPLVAVGKDVFENDKMGLVMEFNPAKKQFTLRQSGQVFLYKRDLVQRPEPDFNEKDGK